MTKAMRAQVSLVPQYAMSALHPDLIADAAGRRQARTAQRAEALDRRPPLVPAGPEHLVVEAER